MDDSATIIVDLLPVTIDSTTMFTRFLNKKTAFQNVFNNLKSPERGNAIGVLQNLILNAAADLRDPTDPPEMEHELQLATYHQCAGVRMTGVLKNFLKLTVSWLIVFPEALLLAQARLHPEQ